MSCRPVNWLLMLAILVAVFVPVHYHLHHLEMADSAGHTHVIDLHLVSGDIDEVSHHDYGTTSFSAVSDNAVKIKSSITPFILLTLLLVVFPVAQKLVTRHPGYHIKGLQRKIPHFTPLLRAPPLK